MMARVLLSVQGRVQGVCYRQSTLEHARLLGLTGWVSNQADGSVSIDAQGPRERLESLIVWCWKGPPSARVVNIVVEWMDELEPGYTHFEVLR